MKKRITYASGHTYIWTDSIKFEEHGGKIIDEVDLDNATNEEIERLKKDPHDNKLLQEIGKRHKLK